MADLSQPWNRTIQQPLGQILMLWGREKSYLTRKVFNFVFSLVWAEEFSLSCFSKLFNETRSDTGQKTKKKKVKQTLYGP